VRRARRGDDDVASPGVETLILDRPAHPAGTHDDHVILLRVMAKSFGKVLSEQRTPSRLRFS
jgi:hypothetical protein